MLSVVGLLAGAYAADVKPDKKKSQAAFARGQKADEAGRRDEAIAAYTEAIGADGSNVAALRARGKDYLAAGDSGKAGADFEAAVAFGATYVRVGSQIFGARAPHPSR